MATTINDPGLLMQEYSALSDAGNQLGNLHYEFQQKLQDLINRANMISQGNQGMWIGRGGQTFERAFAQNFAALRTLLSQLEAAHALLPRLVSAAQEADTQASALFQAE
ncbi:MAG: hypothetical protein U0528_04620 [Anaerolineae bacterium]|nr:hypothetical protein [Anaerolineae bacterium]